MTTLTVPEHDLDLHYSLHGPCLRAAAEAENSEQRSRFLGLFLTLRVVDLFSEGATKEATLSQVANTAINVRQLGTARDVDQMLEVLQKAQLAVETNSFGVLWFPLIELATTIERDLRLDEALDVLETALRLPGESGYRAPANVRKGRLLRLSGRLNSSIDSYRTAAELARANGDAETGIRSETGLALTYVRSGNLPLAEEILLKVLEKTIEMDNPSLQAGAQHNLAMVYSAKDEPRRAIIALNAAFELHTDPLRKLRVISDMGMVFKDMQHYEAARNCFEIYLAGETTWEMDLNANLELLELAACISDRMMFDRICYELTEEELPPDANVDFHIKLGRGLASFGDIARAIGKLEAAVELAEAAGLNTYLFQAETELEQVRSGIATIPTGKINVPTLSAEIRGVSDSIKRVRSTV